MTANNHLIPSLLLSDKVNGAKAQSALVRALYAIFFKQDLCLRSVFQLAEQWLAYNPQSEVIFVLTA